MYMRLGAASTSSGTDVVGGLLGGIGGLLGGVTGGLGGAVGDWAKKQMGLKTDAEVALEKAQIDAQAAAQTGMAGIFANKEMVTTVVVGAVAITLGVIFIPKLFPSKKGK